MKRLLAAALVSGAMLAFAGCGNGNDEKAVKGDHSQHDEGINAESSPAVVKIKDDKVNAIYQHYIHLTTALTNGDAAEAKIAAAAIEAGAKQTPGAEAVASNSSKIAAAADIEQQRRIYSDLSNEFIALVKKSGVTGGPLYVDFCPMALNDKGAYWLSKNKDIRNPYFGEKMMTCGEVKETIDN